MEDETNTTEIPRGLRVVVRFWGAVSGLCSAALGILVLFTLSATCLGMGIYMMVMGAIILAFEAPMCCQFVPALVTMSNWFEKYLRFWIRGSLYFLLALLPVIFCLEVSTFVGCGSVMITAALYGVLAIGKKGAHANKTTNSEEIEMKTNLVDKKGDPNYVGEAEP
ncbi:calcium channel flower-like [Stylophora pistillata]|uniref:Calcium channel flower n=1 Tax=Stylophora pistillata TaxID=50429 RepID=A0A2B4R7E9_STYPI|nr:calcium channel flower-like [Stylophora pistillata]PFX12749.1 Calcium channel flower [Stylophora pistillata]